MQQIRIAGLLVVVFAMGCSRSGPEDASTPRKLIIGRWEGAEGGIEFTTAGSAFLLPKQELSQYRFVDDRTIEVSMAKHSGRLTGVSVGQDELSFMTDGKTIKLRRVKEFSAALIARANARPVSAPNPSLAEENKKAQTLSDSSEKVLSGEPAEVTHQQPKATPKALPELSPLVVNPRPADAIPTPPKPTEKTPDKK